MSAVEFFQDGDGRLSAMRLSFLLWVVGIGVIWCMDSVTATKLQEIPSSVLTMIGILVTGKTVQSFGENAAKP